MTLFATGPKASYLAHRKRIHNAIRRVLDSGQYILGAEVEAFEAEFAAYLGRGAVVGVGSGTEALHLALRLRGIGAQDTVLTVSHTAVATVAAIELAGAKPMLVDVDPRSYTLDPDRLAATLDQLEDTSIKAVIPVHLYGHPADMSSIMEVARRFDLCVIEDCAQSHGASIEDRKTGTWGDFAAFSFYPTKNLGGLGDGGALVCDPELADTAKALREYGWKERYVSYAPGMNTRLDELQAAVLRVQLAFLDEDNASRRELASVYGALLSSHAVAAPTERVGAMHVFHQYVIRSPQRDALREFLTARGIPTAIHYPLPVHQQPAYADRLEVGNGGLAVSERLSREILSLPIHPQLAADSVEYVCQQVSEWEATAAL